MTVEACKAGKDVYVEKPVACAIEEAAKMTEAARASIIASSRPAPCNAPRLDFQEGGRPDPRRRKLGEITFVRTWNYGHSTREGIGTPADS